MVKLGDVVECSDGTEFTNVLIVGAKYFVDWISKDNETVHLKGFSPNQLFMARRFKRYEVEEQNGY